MLPRKQKAWKVSGMYLEGVGKVFGSFLEGFLKEPKRCLELVWKVFEGYLEHVFNMSWKYKILLSLRDILEFFLWFNFHHLPIFFSQTLIELANLN